MKMFIASADALAVGTIATNGGTTLRFARRGASLVLGARREGPVGIRVGATTAVLKGATTTHLGVAGICAALVTRALPR